MARRTANPALLDTNGSVGTVCDWSVGRNRAGKFTNGVETASTSASAPSATTLVSDGDKAGVAATAESCHNRGTTWMATAVPPSHSLIRARRSTARRSDARNRSPCS